MSKKTTRRAMLASVVALALCITMLIGTTYAWFTDSVTSAGNKIKAGTLDIDLFMYNGTGYIEIDNTSDPIFGGANSLIAQNVNSDTLWEPGKTQVAYLKLVNNGNLWLKYSVAVDVKDVSKSLYEAMRYEIIPDAQPTAVAAWDAATAVAVQPGTQATAAADVPMAPGTEHFFALAVHMQEDAGNEYQAGEVDFDLKVLATQYNKEEDAFGPDYDKTATYPVADQNEFATALATAAASNEPTTIALSAGNYTIPANTNIDGLKIEAQEGTTVDTINISATAGSLKNFEAEGVTFVSSTNNAWTGILSQKTTLENATFKKCVFSSEGNSGRTNGVYGPYATGTITFEDCTIYGDVYGINFSTIDTLVLKNCDISGWNTFGGSNTANVIIENCRFHKSGYNKLGFYTNATITNCVFDTNFFDANTGDYGNFTGGIDARRNDQLPVTITLSGNTVKNVNTGDTTPLAAANLLTANYTDTTTNTVMHCNPTWILDGVDVTTSVPLE